nr:ent-kaur-16-ene synthase, chloroplastic-like [Tanacetum cinerariifolium]
MIAQSLSSIMPSPSSHKLRCSWAVGSCKDQHRPLAVQTASSDAGLANHSTMSFDMTKERIRKLFTNVELSRLKRKKRKKSDENVTKLTKT